MIARALEDRSARVPPQEHPARRPPARDRHRSSRMPPSAAALDRVAERLNWSAPFDRGSGTGQARARPRDRHQGGDLADHLGRDRQRQRRRQRRRSIAAPSTWARAPTPRMAQMVGEVLNMPAESVRVVPRDTDVTPYDMGTLGSRSLFHMGHAVKLAAEEARDKIQQLARDVGEPEGSNIPVAALFQKKYGMQAGNIIGTGTYKPDYVPSDPVTGYSPNVTPFWMVVGRRRRGRGRHRDRPRAASRSSSTSSTAASRSIRRSSRRRFPARRSCSSASRCSRRCTSTPAR